MYGLGLRKTVAYYRKSITLDTFCSNAKAWFYRLLALVVSATTGCGFEIFEGVWDHVSHFNYLHSRNSLCKPSWKNVKPYHRDSNQGPSAYRVDALTTAL